MNIQPFSINLRSNSLNLFTCYSRKWVTCVGESCISSGWYQLQVGASPLFLTRWQHCMRQWNQANGVSRLGVGG